MKFAPIVRAFCHSSNCCVGLAYRRAYHPLSEFLVAVLMFLNITTALVHYLLNLDLEKDTFGCFLSVVASIMTLSSPIVG